MDDQTADQAPPEVTLEPADNGWVVRHHQRSGKRDEPGRTIRRVASTDDEALAHARTAMSGGGKAKSAKRKPLRDGQPLGADSSDAGEGAPAASPAAHAMRRPARNSARRRRPRVGGRR